MSKSVLLLSLCLFCVNALAIPNPAATNCTSKGYRYMLIRSTGICLFPDKSYCEEWAFYRGKCKPGQNKPAPAVKQLLSTY